MKENLVPIQQSLEKRPGSNDPDGNIEFRKLFGKIFTIEVKKNKLNYLYKFLLKILNKYNLIYIDIVLNNILNFL